MTIIDNSLYVAAALTLIVLVAIYLGKTKLGKKLGVALLSILLAAFLANLGLLPKASDDVPIYHGVFFYIAPLCIFYLMLGVNLTSLKKVGLPMLGLFILGSVATCIGILSAWHIVGFEETLGENGRIIAGMLTGTYTGGSINFNALALEYNFQEKGALYAGVIAVDNVVTTLWIIITLALPKLLRTFLRDKRLKSSKITSAKAKRASYSHISSLACLLALGLTSLLISELVTKLIPGVPSILTLTTLGIIIAQIPFVTRLKGADALGLYLAFVFLAVIGAYCDIAAVFELRTIGLTLLLFASLAVFVHGVLIVTTGGLFYRDWDMVAIVSQANIGGGTTALALAENLGRKDLVLPAILVGNLGNALGTYLGFSIIHSL